MRGVFEGAIACQDSQTRLDLQASSIQLQRVVSMPRVKHLVVFIWGLVTILGAVALAFVTGLVNPQEKVNGLWLVVAAACIYVLAFRFYGRWISRRVMQLCS